MKFFSGRIAFDLLLLIGAAFGIQQSSLLAQGGGISWIGPADFPRVVCIIATLALSAIIYDDFRNLRKRTGPAVENIVIAVVIAAVFGAYIVLLPVVGFFIATIAFLFAAIHLCSWAMIPKVEAPSFLRTSVVAAIVAVAGTGISYLVFSTGFGLIFP